MTLISILINRELRSHPTFILMCNLALTDLVISSFVDSFSVVDIFLGKTYFDSSSSLCTFIGSVCLAGKQTLSLQLKHVHYILFPILACSASLLTMCALAVNRFVKLGSLWLIDKSAYDRFFLLKIYICRQF